MGVLCLMLYTGVVSLYHALDNAPPDSASGVTTDPEPETERTTSDRISVRTGDSIIPVPIANIEWIEAADSYVRLHLADGKTHLYRSSMTAMMDRLTARPFLRVHRSTIVRIDAIEELETPAATGTYLVVLRDGTRRRVSRRYRDDLLSALGASA
jgi:two-component system LytT family response regulator